MPNDAAYRIADKIIKETEKSGSTTLDLSLPEDEKDAPKLTELPDSISRLRQLKVLLLSRNQLTVLPKSLGQLTLLVRLDLSYNRLAALPPEIGKLTALTFLNVGFNTLTTLPPEICNLTALINLYLSGNNLSKFPVEIGSHTALEMLSLYENKLTTLAPEIGRLRRLELLGLRNNKLTALPPEIGQLAALKQLNLHNNQLMTLPAEIGELAALESITLNNTLLTSLPSEMGKLAALTKLRVEDIPTLRHPPADILELGAQASVKYLRALWGGEEKVWESKVLLVGNGQEGKTWLYEALNGRPNGGRRRDEGATIGIHIGPLDVQKADNAQQMRLQIWDFAGQDNNYATHQFFFSDRTLFLVIWSMRANWDDKKMRRWLQNIHDRSPGARVLLVHCQS